MLIKCPECELTVSDKALSCPHCGYPMKKEAQKQQKKRRSKRLPNGFGQITEIKGANLKKPFRAMVTIGKKENGRPICQILKPEGYFATYNEAYEALIKYNKNPYNINNLISMEDLFQRWRAENITEMADETVSGYDQKWKFCGAIKDMYVRDVRERHIKNVLENGEYISKTGRQVHHITDNSRKQLKSLLNMMFDYAVEYELCDRNPSRNVKLGKETVHNITKKRKSHISFTDDEMAMLWANVDAVPNVDLILIQCYTGLRPKELCLIERDKLNITEWYMSGGIKTAAGKDRIIPIHSVIRELVQKHYEISSDLGLPYLFVSTHRGKYRNLDYPSYRNRYNKVKETLKLNPEHSPHDPRKQFSTMAKKYQINEYALKRIIGHDVRDITEKIYTDRPVSWLSEEMEKIRADEYIASSDV